jgi:hypothetical protein
MTALRLTALALALMMIGSGCGTTEPNLSPALARIPVPAVTAPPESFFEIVRERDREAARAFYRKHILVNGLPVVASGDVADAALQRTHWLVTHLLAGRPDILSTMVSNGMYLIIIGKDQVYTDMPEYRNHPNPQYVNERVRGTGGKPTSFGEENLLCLPLDRYDDESIGLHEFCHTIDGALRSMDPTWNQRKTATYRKAVEKGLWKNAYGGSNAGEYWAEIAQSYFDCNRVNNWNHNHIGTREQLRAYDPDAYELVRATFNLSPQQDWRYSWLMRQPSVIRPPARFKIDPYYTKFTWAREFPVVGRKASDEALLRANDTIRKMFAYRHDVLKALIADDLKLVVLGRREKVSDLPEYEHLRAVAGIEPDARTFEYVPEARLLIVAEEKIHGKSGRGMIEDGELLRQFGRALYYKTCLRPVDPNWSNRGQSVQQYELRVKRLDVQFDDKLKELHAAAVANGLWKSTDAEKDRVDYWVEGLTAYFDAGTPRAPAGRSDPIVKRERLREYDAALYELVHETMAYEGREDWRYTAAR